MAKLRNSLTSLNLYHFYDLRKNMTKIICWLNANAIRSREGEQLEYSLKEDEFVIPLSVRRDLIFRPM